MSFVRFGVEDSSVYLYESASTLNFVCCDCTLSEQTTSGFYSDVEFEKVSQLIEHLKDHEAEGDTVPQMAYDNLKRRQKQGDDNRAKKKERMRRGIYDDA